MSIEKLVDALLERAIQLKATDIHLIPRKDKYDILYRFQGFLRPYRKISHQTAERCISHLKFISSMDISEKRKPQSGSFQITLSDTITSIRISTLPTVTTKESLVIRILPCYAYHSLEKSALFPNQAKKLYAFMMHAHGLIIFTGPTGSGKSTTMYQIVENYASKSHRQVITLEDPVEKQNDQFLQVPINEKAGITYHTGLKAILRHDPDVILVGEIRDAETAKMAIRASLTGHLVLTTLHTRDTKGAIYRLIEFGVRWHEIEQTLIAVTAQRLVQLLCPFCGEQCSSYCLQKSGERRVAVYEVLHGKALQQVLKEARGEKATYNYPTLQYWLRKGIALGYISNTEFNRWVFQEKK